jgi:hypothetical protein
MKRSANAKGRSPRTSFQILINQSTFFFSGNNMEKRECIFVFIYFASPPRGQETQKSQVEAAVRVKSWP